MEKVMRLGKEWRGLFVGRTVLMESVFFLTLFQAANYILPLIALPYLVRVFGPAKFGLMVFAQASIQYLGMVTDYGFNLSATRQIALWRADQRKVMEIFSAVMFLKFLLMMICFLLLLVAVLTIPKLSADRLVYLSAFSLLIGNVLFPVWFFLGLERMRDVTVGTILVRVLATASIFIFVRHESDFLLAIQLQNLGSIVSGILALILVSRMYPLGVRLPSLSSMKEALVGGFDVFVSTAAISLYTTSNVLVLGFLTTHTAVGNYGAAEKLVRSVLGAFSPLIQALYPHVTAMVSQSRDRALLFIKRVGTALGMLACTLSCVLLLFSKQIVLLVFGPKYLEAIVLVRIMSILPLVVSMGVVFGILTLLPFGHSRSFRRAIVAGALFNMLAIVPLTLVFREFGTAASYAMAETIVTATMYYMLRRKGIRLW